MRILYECTVSMNGFKVDNAAGGEQVESGRREEDGKSEIPDPDPDPDPGLDPDPDPDLNRDCLPSPLRRPGAAPPLRLLEALRERLRYMHYSLRTEEAYVYWVRGFIRWAGLRHPRDLGAGEVQDFLVMLANERRVAAGPHRQALSALLFL